MPAQVRRIVLATVVATASMVVWRRRPVRHPEATGSWDPVPGAADPLPRDTTTT